MRKIVSSNSVNDSLMGLLKSNKLILLEVRANWCGESHIIAPVIRKIEDEFNNVIKIVRVDYDTHKECLYKLNVNSIPVVLSIKEGKVLSKIDGTISRRNLKNLVQDLLNNHNQETAEENYL